MERHNYFIYAYPASYGGLHGMYNFLAVADSTKSEAEEIGYEMAREVIDSYHLVDELYSYDDYVEECEEIDDTPTEGAYWDRVEDILDDECACEIYILKDGVDVDFINQLGEDPTSIIDTYCIPE